MRTCECKECDICAMKAEIELLNKHVAMFRVFLHRLTTNYDCDEGHECRACEALSILEMTASDWLKTHDAKIRDEALEEAASKCIDFGDTCSEIGKINLGDCFAEEIRALKAKP